MDSAYPGTIRRLADAHAGLTPQLQKAARYLVENPAEVGLNSMRRVAAAAGVKPATVTRLAKTLGFSGYDELREPFRQRLRKRSPEFASRLQDLQERGEGDQQRTIAELRAQELNNVEYSLSDDNYPFLNAAAEVLHNSRRVYVLGLRGAYAPAFLFHYTYQLFRENSIMLDTRAGIFADKLRGIGAEDALLVVSFAPYTLMTIDAVDYAKESGARIVAVTDSMMSPAATAATATIITQHQSPSFYHSFTGALAIVQALTTLLVTKAGGDAVTIVEKAEEQLARISAYW